MAQSELIAVLKTKSPHLAGFLFLKD